MDMLPLCLAVLPWGVLTGALATQAGFSVAQSQALSLLVFAGAAQLSAMTFFAAGAAYGAIFASTFVISARHLLYSLTFRQHIAQEPWLTRIAVAFLLTDEMFAVSEAHTKRSGAFSVRYALISGLLFYIAWNLATAFGIALATLGASADSLGLDSLGLEFAIVATFIAMTFGEIRRFPVLVAVVVSGSVAVFTKPFFSDSYIIFAAISGMIAAYCCDKPDVSAAIEVNQEQAQ